MKFYYVILLYSIQFNGQHIISTSDGSKSMTLKCEENLLYYSLIGDSLFYIKQDKLPERKLKSEYIGIYSFRLIVNINGYYLPPEVFLENILLLSNIIDIQVLNIGCFHEFKIIMEKKGFRKLNKKYKLMQEYP